MAEASVAGPDLKLPVVFLVLAVVVAVTQIVTRRAPLSGSDVGGPARIWRWLTVLAAVGMVTVAVVQLHADHRREADSTDWMRTESAALAAAEAAAEEAGREDLEASLLRLLAGLEPGLMALLDSANDSMGAGPPATGELFRQMAVWPATWAEVADRADDWPLAAILWRADQRVAWTGGAEPLLLEGEHLKGRIGRYLRRVRPLTDDYVLELQVRIGEREVEPRFPANPRRRGQAGRFLIAMTCWMIALAGVGRIGGGPAGLLVGLWIGRISAALLGFFQWLVPAFPQWRFPAAPASLPSLVDPAYFATPFAQGLFASTADALLTTALVALTVGYRLLGHRGLFGLGWDADRRGRPAPVLRALVFGLVCGALLLGLRFFVSEVAENANPRLIGTGIPLSILTFWGLHLVLVLGGLSVTALAVGLSPITTPPWRSGSRRWLGTLALVGVGGLLATLAIPDLWWGARLVLLLAVVGLCSLGTMIGTSSRLLSRSAWSAVLLVTVVWNYTSLREVYDQAERGWLERKIQVITESRDSWMRFLLDDALQEMVALETDRDPATRPDPAAADEEDGFDDSAEIWRDEAAYNLWSRSALRDLGFASLVEIIDTNDREESLFATGFMRDTQYELLARGPWLDAEGQPAQADTSLVFQLERRLYTDGEEEILAAELARLGDRGWLRVELPVRSWRIPSLLEGLGLGRSNEMAGYRPRAEVDRPVMMLHGDDAGWLASGQWGYPDPATDVLLAGLKAGEQNWVELPVGDRRWLCVWRPLPADVARSPGEGFLLGLARPGLGANLLDLSRLALLDALLFSVLLGMVNLVQRLSGASLPDPEAGPERETWRSSFQERFLAGYLLLGLILLLVVGASVDKVGYDRVRAEARRETREGLSLAVEQLRSLLVEQAAAMASSDYIADLLLGQLAGQRPVGPLTVQQGMVFAADGALLLDETLSDLSPAEARQLLDAGREAPLVVVQDDDQVYIGAVIPIDLSGIRAAAAGRSAESDMDEVAETGFFFYRQRLDAALLAGLAELVRGQATLNVDGKPVLSSHPDGLFFGRTPLLVDPVMITGLSDHPAGPGVFAATGRPFAFTGCRALPSFARDEVGRLWPRVVPAVLAMAFPDREREYAGQRRQTVLFLAGLANLILLTALVLALLLSWRIFGPLRVLLTATRQLARGDFSAPLPEPGPDEVGRLAAAFDTMRDELQGARDSLAARERFLATVLDRVPVGVAVLDPAGQVVSLNPAGRTILDGFYAGLPTDDGARRLLGRIQDKVIGPGLAAGELASDDGRLTLRGAQAPLDLPDGRINTMLVFEDISEFLETKKLALNAELARQVAHEIKNPLTPIQLSVQLLQQAWRDQHPDVDRILQDTTARVLDQVGLLRSIAAEFSLLGRPGELELETLDLPQQLQRVIGSAVDPVAAENAGDSGLRIDVAPDDVPAVLGHAESVLKIIGNLLRNSLDAAREDEPMCIEVSWRRDEQTVTLVWRDNGTGLAGEVADRLFDPYFSTKSKGTGLGLAICRNLADRMGGRINLANRDDGPGAVAELTLRRNRPD